MAQTKGTNGAFAIDAGRLGLAAGGGRPLPEAVRARMEGALGADFSAVRIHTGPHPAQIGAIAFTTGSDIYFAPGRFQPDSTPGQLLLGHELAHVIQQRAGRVGNPFGSGVAVIQDPALETEADRMGHRAVSYHAPVQARPAAGQPSAPAAGQPRAQVPGATGGLAVPRPAVVGELVQRSAVVQRVLVGTDPLADLADPTSKGLAYGTSTARTKTVARVDAHLTLTGVGPRKKTIDQYNDEIGLTGLMGGNLDPCNIFKVREALGSLTPVAKLQSFPGAVPAIANDPDLMAWITKLVFNQDYIGLKDLGGAKGEKKLGLTVLSNKDRYHKNFVSKGWYTASHLTQQQIYDWLSHPSYAAALADATGNPALTTGIKRDLALWIRKAFWRRTSKLGIDFTVGRGHTVHMNTAADRKFNPETMLPSQMAEGPDQLKKVKLPYGRLITTSEYRHLKKGIKKGTIPAANVNFYSEY